VSLAIHTVAFATLLVAGAAHWGERESTPRVVTFALRAETDTSDVFDVDRIEVPELESWPEILDETLELTEEPLTQDPELEDLSEAARDESPLHPPFTPIPMPSSSASQPNSAPRRHKPRATPPKPVRTEQAVPASASRAAPRAAPRMSSPLRVIYVPDIRQYYPADALRLQVQGSVRVVLHIDADGIVRHVAVERSSGFAVLDRAALTLARAYRFSAGSGWRRTRLPVTFRIEQRRG
jgi:protein TonB